MMITISVILNLIQNQADSDFRQNDSYGQPAIIKQNFSPIFNFLISAPPGRGEFLISNFHLSFSYLILNTRYRIQFLPFAF